MARTHQNETWSHAMANHTKNIAVGSTAIRQAMCPVILIEV
jgi:hypothetical protein